MNDVQVWSAIGVLAAAVLGVVGLIATMFTRTMKAGFAAVDARFQVMDARFEALDSRFDAKLKQWSLGWVRVSTGSSRESTA